MARYRLRFQLQEIDLAHGETLLGRSPDCHVTIEDPLVSRQHARIVISDDGAVLEDLGSRNGVRVNGEVRKGSVALKDRDRLRIGMQEFVFHTLASASTRLSGKSTGFLRYCVKCRYPYAEEILVCPHCGHEDAKGFEENTLSGVLAESRPNWAAQLLLELLERALAIGRWEEAEQVLRRAGAALDEKLASGGDLDAPQFDQLTGGASRVAQARQSEEWAKWVITTSARLRRIPTADVVARLRTIPLRDAAGVLGAIDATLAQSRDRDSSTSDEQKGVVALEQWRKELRQQD